MGPGFLLGTMSKTVLPIPEQLGISKEVEMEADGRLLAVVKQQTDDNGHYPSPNGLPWAMKTSAPIYGGQII